MATNKMIIQDDKGNSYYPQTSSDVVFTPAGKTATAVLGNIDDSALDGSIKGKSLTEMIKILFQNVDNGKNDVYSAIVGKGTTPTSKDFSALVAGINAISVGRKVATGTLNVRYGGIVVGEFAFNRPPEAIILRDHINPERATHVFYNSAYIWEMGGVGHYEIILTTQYFQFTTTLSQGIALDWIAVERS